MQKWLKKENEGEVAPSYHDLGLTNFKYLQRKLIMAKIQKWLIKGNKVEGAPFVSRPRPNKLPVSSTEVNRDQDTKRIIKADVEGVHLSYQDLGLTTHQRD